MSSTPDGALVTVADGGGTRAGRVSGGEVVLLGAADAGEVLRHQAAGREVPEEGAVALDEATLGPVVPRPGKIVCVGLNYASHIAEMGRDLPVHPTLFGKYPEALVGPRQDIDLPPESEKVDWEAELCVVVGRPVRRADEDEARSAIAGYTVINDVTARDWQYRTLQWLQGKTFEGTSPLGPWMVPAGAVDPDDGLALQCWIGDDLVQSARTDDLVFGPAALVSYISQIITLQPGDLIATGTPGGVGAGMDPPRFLADGDVVRTEVEGIGALVNPCRAEAAPTSI